MRYESTQNLPKHLLLQHPSQQTLQYDDDALEFQMKTAAAVKSGACCVTKTLILSPNKLLNKPMNYTIIYLPLSYKN